jgi:hypothetical protein
MINAAFSRSGIHNPRSSAAMAGQHLHETCDSLDNDESLLLITSLAISALARPSLGVETLRGFCEQ